MGDANAHIGKEVAFQGTIGAQSLHQNSNDNGHRLIDFAMSRNLVISSTFFTRKNIYKQTWVSPDGNSFNQIDHILVDRRWASSVMNVRTYRGASCGSDHFLVKMIYRCRITRAMMGGSRTVTRFDISKLKEEETREELKSEINDKIEKIHVENNMDKMTVDGIWEAL